MIRNKTIKSLEMEKVASEVAEIALIDYLIDDVSRFIYEKFEYDIEDTYKIAVFAVSKHISELLELDCFETFERIWESFNEIYYDSI